MRCEIPLYVSIIELRDLLHQATFYNVCVKKGDGERKVSVYINYIRSLKSIGLTKIRHQGAGRTLCGAERARGYLLSGSALSSRTRARLFKLLVIGGKGGRGVTRAHLKKCSNIAAICVVCACGDGQKSWEAREKHRDPSREEARSKLIGE